MYTYQYIFTTCINLKACALATEIHFSLIKFSLCHSLKMHLVFMYHDKKAITETLFYEKTVIENTDSS